MILLSFVSYQRCRTPGLSQRCVAGSSLGLQEHEHAVLELSSSGHCQAPRNESGGKPGRPQEAPHITSTLFPGTLPGGGGVGTAPGRRNTQSGVQLCSSISLALPLSTSPVVKLRGMRVLVALHPLLSSCAIVVHYSRRSSSDPVPHLGFKAPCKSPGTLTLGRPH